MVLPVHPIPSPFAWRHHHAETVDATEVPHGRVGVAGKLRPRRTEGLEGLEPENAQIIFDVFFPNLDVT